MTDVAPEGPSSPFQALRSQVVAPAGHWLRREVHALPVDVFRILVGLLAAAYFARLLYDAPHITHPDGLIDHALVQEIYWFTRLSLFQAGTPWWVLYGCLAVACAGAWAIVAGWRPRIWGAVLLVIAASTYRWNFVVMYLDDAIVHVMLFWLLLLPIGRTLVLAEWVRDRSVLDRWRQVTVPGAAVRCLQVQVCWIYLLAGGWKLNSLLWRDGFGLYASMKVGIARMGDLWGPRHLPFLEWSNYAVLAIEPILPIPLLFRTGHPLKWIAALGLIVFNLFILVTLGIPFAILGLTCTLPLFMGEELMGLLAGRRLSSPALSTVPRLNRRGTLSVVFLTTILLATSRHIPVFGALNEPAYAALWMVGVAQDYRLFNWIDRVNYRVDTTLEIRRGAKVLREPPGSRRYPHTFRAKLLQAYAHDIRWLILPDEHRFALRLSIARRHARWVCRHSEVGDRIAIRSRVSRVVRSNLDFSNGRDFVFAEFTCLGPGLSVPAADARTQTDEIDDEVLLWRGLNWIE